MIKKEITLDQYNRLKPCSVINHKGTWIFNNYRVVRIGKVYTTVAYPYNGSVLQSLYKNSKVKSIAINV